MKRVVERGVDSSMAMELQEEHQFLNAPPFKESFTAQSWAKKFYKDNEEEPEDKEPPINPFGNIGGKASSEEKESNSFTDWISENPGKAIIAALLIGGGAYLIGSYIKRNYFDDTNKSSLGRRRKTRIKKEATPDPDISITKEDVLIGTAAAAGGAILGAVLKDTAVVAAVPVGVIGAVTGKIPLMAFALGLALSGQLRKMFQGFSQSNDSQKETDRSAERRAQGYVDTMLGTFKLRTDGLNRV